MGEVGPLAAGTNASGFLSDAAHDFIETPIVHSIYFGS
jgi:hypothetical protein